jgi:signal peptidase II
MPYFYLTLLLVLLDQAAKLLIQTRMLPMQSIQIINGWFSLTYATNYGAAFGILQSQTVLLIAITLGVLVMVWINRRKMNEYPHIMQVGLAMALGGAIGNLADRIRLGYVVDFMNFYVWPIFNIADMAIVTGVCLIVIGLFWKDFELKRNKETQDLQSAENFDRSVSGEEKP